MPEHLATGVGLSSYLESMGPAVVQESRLCGACGTPQVKNGKGHWVVSHVSKSGRCVWHADHFCAVTGNIVAAGTYRPFLRFLGLVFVDMVAVWSLVLVGWLLHTWQEPLSALGPDRDANPSPAATVWHAMGSLVSGNATAVPWRSAAGALAGAVVGTDPKLRMSRASLFGELAKRALAKSGLGVLAVRCGLEGMFTICLMGMSAAGGVVAAGLGIPVLAAIGRGNGGRLAEGRRLLGAASWATYARQVWRGCVWWLGSTPKREDPTWAALAAGGFEFHHDLAYLEQ
jgi:hypothetical protein